MQPWQFTTWLDFADHWQSLIAGAFALVAGVVAYRAGKIQALATEQAAQAQITANDKKDRLQAHCIAVGIYPELLHVKVSHERSQRIITDDFPKLRASFTTQIVSMIREVKIFEPPLTKDNAATLYILGKAGGTILQLLSVILQYNHMVETLAKQLAENVDRLDQSDRLNELTGHLRVMAGLISSAEREIMPIHNELPGD